MERLVRDPILVHQFFLDWKGFPEGSKERGDIIESYCNTFGVSRQTAYKDMGKLLKGEKLSTVSGLSNKKKSVVDIEKKNKRIEQALIIARIKSAVDIGKKGKPASTEDAINAAIKKGEISSEDALSRSTLDRAMDSIGVSSKKLNAKRYSARLVAEYSNHCWVADATPISHYFFSFKKGDLVFDKTVDIRSYHIESVLEKKELAKIWVYRVVDLYSKQYFQKVFAPKGRTKGAKYGGENSMDWLETLRCCMLPKTDLIHPKDGRVYKNIPMQGVPKLLMTDQTCGLHADISKAFLQRLGIEHRQRDVNNPSGGGAVESRHGHFQRQYENKIVREDIASLEELEFYMSAFSSYDNQKKGYSTKWLEGTKKVPVRIVTLENLHDATVVQADRVVNNWGCISISTIEYTVPSDVVPGEKVTAFRNFEGKWCIQREDGTIHPLIEGRIKKNVETYEIMDGKGDLAKDSENDKNREFVKNNPIKFSTDAWLPEPVNKVIAFPVRNTVNTETHSTMSGDVSSVEKSLDYLKRESGKEFTKEETETLKNALDQYLKSEGKVPSDVLHDFLNIIIKTKVG